MKADLRILYGSLTYCDDIDQTLNRFGRNYKVFINDRVFFSCSQYVFDASGGNV